MAEDTTSMGAYELEWAMCEEAAEIADDEQARYDAMTLAEFVDAMIFWQEEVGDGVIASMLKFYQERGYLTDKQRRYAANIMAEIAVI